jgi:hypothetical protein
LTHFSSKDPIDARAVDIGSEFAVSCLANLVIEPFNTSTFPNLLKTAIVRPLIKKPTLDAKDINNYRPVSNLSFLSKVIERLILLQIQVAIQDSPSFPSFQSAYRKFYSTETAINCVLNDLYTLMDNGKVTLLVAHDLSAAFDLVDHGILLKRLNSMFGISGPIFKIIESFLTGRYFKVMCEKISSEPYPLTTGVPQGSVLGPILFTLYVAPVV